MFRRTLPLALLISTSAYGQSFQNHYGAGKYEEGVAVVVDELAITSVVRHYREGYGYGLQLLRTSLTGTGAVTLDIPMPGAVFPQGAVHAPDGDIVICGSIIPDGRHDHDALLMKVTVSGTTVWTWTSDNSGVDEQFLGVDLLDDGYVAGGVRRGNADSDALLARFNTAGSLSWMEHYGTPQDDQVSGVAHDATGIMAVGRSNSLVGDVDAFTLRTDLTGSQQWAQAWGGLEDDAAVDVLARSDGSFVWAGYTDNYPLSDTTQYGEHFRHAWVMGLNANGDSLWTSAPGDTLLDRQAYTIVQAASGDLLIGGEKDLGHKSDAFVMRLNSTGTVLWQQYYALQRTDRLRDLLLLPDGGFIGTGKCFAAQSGQVLLMRKNSSGQ